MNTPDIFTAPESVAEQTARLEREEAGALKRQQREELEDRAAAPLVGKVGDIGQRDMFGGGDLFGR